MSRRRYGSLKKNHYDIKLDLSGPQMVMIHVAARHESGSVRPEGHQLRTAERLCEMGVLRTSATSGFCYLTEVGWQIVRQTEAPVRAWGISG